MNLTFRSSRLLLGTGFVLTVLGLADADEKPRQIGLLFEGNFQKAEIASEVDGAKKTQLVAAYTWDYGVRLFTDKTWKESGLDWDSFAIRAGVVADRIAKDLKPNLIRDRYGVIDYAIVNGKDPFLSCAITSPFFIDAFVNTLGNRVHVVIVDRHIMYVFPATGGRLRAFGPSLVHVFKTTPSPVSLEIFEVDKKGYRVIGEIERQQEQELP